MFLIYINDLPDQLNAKSFIYADDTSLFYSFDPKNPINDQDIVNDMNKISEWSQLWKLDFKPEKM